MEVLARLGVVVYLLGIIVAGLFGLGGVGAAGYATYNLVAAEETAKEASLEEYARQEAEPVKPEGESSELDRLVANQSEPVDEEGKWGKYSEPMEPAADTEPGPRFQFLVAGFLLALGAVSWGAGRAVLFVLAGQ